MDISKIFSTWLVPRLVPHKICGYYPREQRHYDLTRLAGCDDNDDDVVPAGIHRSRPGYHHGFHRHAGPAAQRTDSPGPRSHPGSTALRHTVPTDPDRSGTHRVSLPEKQGLCLSARFHPNAPQILTMFSENLQKEIRIHACFHYSTMWMCTISLSLPLSVCISITNDSASPDLDGGWEWGLPGVCGQRDRFTEETRDSVPAAILQVTRSH